MRDIITGLAIILIVALTAALAAPYFIDWNGQRAFVEARLSHALGQKVTIGSAIDVKLLPTPYLVLGQTVIGDDDGPIRMSIHHLNLELSIAPLLHGEFEVVDARLDEPTIRVTLERDRTLPALPDAPAFQANFRFDRIIVKGGTLAIADPESGRTFVVDNLDFDAEAPSLAGPFKGNGAAGPKKTRTKFHFATTTAQNGRARAHLVVEETSTHAGIDLDGTVALTSGGRQTIRQSFDGTISASGHLDQAASAPLAWRLSGPLKADPDKATLAGGQVRLGGEEANLTLAAAAEADLGSAPALRLDLSAKQLDIDRLAGPPIKGSTPPPPTLPDLATLRRALTAATPPLPTTLDLSIDNATWAGEALSDLAAHIGLGGDGPRRLQIGGNGPGGSHIGVDGTLSDGKLSDGIPPSFAGAAELSADNWPRALGWLAAIDPAVTLKPGDLPFKSAKLTAKVRVDADSIDASGLALTLDRSSLTGSAHVALDSQPAKVTAALDAKALDLDALPDLATLRGPASPLDLDLTLDAKAIKVSRAGTGTLDAGQINLAFTKDGEHVALKTFRAQNLGGASVEASGSLDPIAATLKVKMDAAKLDAFAALVRQLAPGAIADAFVTRAPTLAPAKITMDAALTGKAGGLEPTRVKLAGTLGATNVAASVEPTKENSISLDATLDAPEGSALLRQFGLPTLPLDILGPAHMTLGANGASDQKLDTTVNARFGATQASLIGRFALLSAGQEGSGTINLKSADLAPFLQSLALAFPDMTGTIPADLNGTLKCSPADTTIGDMKGQFGGTTLTGGALTWAPTAAALKGPALTGSLHLDHLKLADVFGLALGAPQATAANAVWSNLTFTTGLVDPPRAAIALKVDTLDLAPDVMATKAVMDLGLAPNLVTLSHATAALAGGKIGGEIILRRDGRQGTLDGKLALDKVAIDLPGLKTNLSATLDLAGSGPSALGLVSSLAGSGEVRLTDLVIPGADPEALPKVFAETESDSLAVDQGAIAKSLQEKAGAPLDAGTRLFGLSLVGGVLRFETKPPTSPDEKPVTSTLDATLDLRRVRLDETVRETLHALPKTWTGPEPSVLFAWTGPITTPTHSVDASGFVDAVATRALARESARIEAYEFDIRERAFFNQRLQSERRREANRLTAEAEARKAEAERKTRLDAMRVEKTRKDAADRAKAQAPPQHEQQ